MVKRQFAFFKFTATAIFECSHKRVLLALYIELVLLLYILIRLSNHSNNIRAVKLNQLTDQLFLKLCYRFVAR